MAEPDDEISEAETLDRARLISKTHLWELAINGVTVVLSIASTGVPLYVVYDDVCIGGKTYYDFGGNIIFWSRIGGSEYRNSSCGWWSWEI